MIPILFENEDVLAVDKPEGLASIPEGVRGTETLLSALQERYSHKLFIAHRLDKEVSGVILFAKNAGAHKHLNDQFSGRDVRKTYVALAHGAIKGTGMIDKPLREFGSGRMGIDAGRGKPSITEFQAIKRLGDYTLLQAHPLTGRRHQIRVHFYSIGHPIVGDSRYGERAVQSTFPRLMLHAQEIAFKLPSDKEVTIEAPMPESFRAVLESIRESHKHEIEKGSERWAAQLKRDFKLVDHRRLAD